ncbi:thioredoxin-like protein 1 [Daphnia magna]|uniref:Thioredoxin protein 1 n=2 Tax=Daphnia magna TaxID=35525 RepID=A0A164LNU2_9CRUS|nr:thioredoxin-like protein 1 [Daphnia magna]KZS04294.1 Thioredoxin protein 1 [Daphnia magna]
MSVRVLGEDSQYALEMNAAGTKLVVVDFTASWCGPCQRIAPFFDELARRYPRAVFLKVDVDNCPETAASNGVSAMPTFIFFRNKTKIDRLQGGNPDALEQKVKQHYGSDDAEEDSSVQGYLDLATFITKSGCECLNESDEHPLAGCLTSNPGYLESDCDEQLIVSLAFNQTLKIHSLKIKAPKDQGPKTLRLFINQPRTIDFDSAESTQPTQEIILQPGDLDGNPVLLRFVKFQTVSNLMIFIKDNQSGTETTRIDHIAIYGSPLSTTNMSDFKRIAGKKGEAH